MHGVGDPVDRVGHPGVVERLLHHRDGVERRRRVVVAPRRSTARPGPGRGRGAASPACPGPATRRGSRPRPRRGRAAPGPARWPGRRSCRSRRRRRCPSRAAGSSAATASSASASPTMLVGVTVSIRSAPGVHVLVAGAELPVRAAAVVEVREHHVVAGGGEPRRHVLERGPDARRIHQVQHDREGAAVLGVEDERGHLPVGRRDVDLALDHPPSLAARSAGPGAPSPWRPRRIGASPRRPRRRARHHRARRSTDPPGRGTRSARREPAPVGTSAPSRADVIGAARHRNPSRTAARPSSDSGQCPETAVRGYRQACQRRRGRGRADARSRVSR